MEYQIIRRLHPNWQPSEVKALSPRERRYWIDVGNYMMELKLSALEVGKTPLEAM